MGMKSAQILFACSLLLAGAAHAQIYKCKDERGQLLLSDKPCASGELLQRKATESEKAEGDMRAYEANMLKQERRNREAARNADSNYGNAQPLQYAPPPVGSQPQSYEERLAERNAGVKSILVPSRIPSAKPTRNQNAAPIPAPPPPQPTTFTNCGGGFCTDNFGGTYHQVSQDFMTGPNGQACHRSGTVWNCN